MTRSAWRERQACRTTVGKRQLFGGGGTEACHRNNHAQTPRSAPTKMSSSGVGDLVEAFITLILGYFVYDLIVGGAIEDALVEGLSPIIGPGWTLLIRILLLIGSGFGFIAFLSDLLGVAHRGARGRF